MAVAGILLVGLLFALSAVLLYAPPRLAGPLVAGVLLGALAGAVLMTVAMYAGTVLTSDPNRDNHNDWLIIFIGPPMGAVPGAVIGPAIALVRHGYRRTAGWVLAVPFTPLAAWLLLVAGSARDAVPAVVAAMAAGTAAWGWRLVLAARA